MSSNAGVIDTGAEKAVNDQRSPAGAQQFRRAGRVQRVLGGTSPFNIAPNDMAVYGRRYSGEL